MASYNRIQWERRRLEISMGNYELDFAIVHVTKTCSKKEREAEADD